jgi:hypothetical protein
MNRKLGTFKTSPNLSSETLFHFTNSLDNLLLILNNGFQARYIYEKLPGRSLAYFAKTVCFCDIPLGNIKEHINWYGPYAIGINRSLAKSLGLSPVHYIHSNSPKYPIGSSKKSKEWFENYQFTHYLKQVRGKQMFIDDTGHAFWKWKTFYNEREWRFFPTIRKVKVELYLKEEDLEKRRVELNTESLPFLNFNPDWIEYILIQDPNELPKLMNVLKSPLYKKNYEILLTKVITFKQIQKDF